jgi:ABC-type lipoprotein release transport system permease subunit
VDPLNFLNIVASGLLLLLLVLFTSAIPAWRAAHVDPMRALHSE